MNIPMWFEATRTGNFDITCAQLCGIGHSRMRGFITVESEEKFQGWLKEQEAFLGITFDEDKPESPTTEPTASKEEV